MHSYFLQNQSEGNAPLKIQKSRKISAMEITERQAECITCEWNMRNKCQNPKQACAPCRQGMGLIKAVENPNFKCPIGKHGKNQIVGIPTL